MVVCSPLVEMIGDVEGRRVRRGVFEVDDNDLPIERGKNRKQSVFGSICKFEILANDRAENEWNVPDDERAWMAWNVSNATNCHTGHHCERILLGLGYGSPPTSSAIASKNRTPLGTDPYQTWYERRHR